MKVFLICMITAFVFLGCDSAPTEPQSPPGATVEVWNVSKFRIYAELSDNNHSSNIRSTNIVSNDAATISISNYSNSQPHLVITGGDTHWDSDVSFGQSYKVTTTSDGLGINVAQY